MSGKDSNKIYTFDAPGANLIINGDASNVSLSNGYTAGFVIANGAPKEMREGDFCKYSEVPQPITINGTEYTTGGSMADILDFRNVNITGNEKANYLLENVSGAIMYFDNKAQSSSLKSILSSGAAWASKEYYDGASEIQTSIRALWK